MKHAWMLATTLSMLSLPAFAAADAEITLYGGLSAGGAYQSAEFNHFTAGETSDTRGDVLSRSTLPYSSDMSDFSAVGQLQIGAGLSFSIFYLGLEALGQVANGDFGSVDGDLVFDGNPAAQIPDSTFAFESQLEMRDFEPAIDFKPGVFLSDNTLLYGRIGAAFNELTLSDTAHYDLVNSFAVRDINSSVSEDVTALRLGLGIEHHLIDRFSIFMDYTYTSYGDISLHTQDNLTADLGGGEVLLFQFDVDTKANDISKQVVLLGFNYHL